MINTIAGKEIKIPSTKVFMEFIKERFDEMKMKLSDLLNKQDNICVTCDVWSSRAQAFLGLTVHFVNSKYELESFVLAFIQLKHKQTHEVMASEIRKVFEEFGIDVRKITHIVTDGGSAFGKAFKVYGRGSDPLVEKCRNIQNGVQSSSSDDELDDQFIQYDDGEAFFANVIQYN